MVETPGYQLNEPDALLYPEFDDLLEYSMAEESTRFFDEILRQD